MVTNRKKYTIEEWIGEFGSCILAEWTKREIGEIIPQVFSCCNGSNRIIDQPFVVVRVATTDEYCHQMELAGQPPTGWFDKAPYYYEVRTD